MRLVNRVALLALLAPNALAAQTALPLKHAPRPTVPAITAADLMTRLYIYADDSMMGRRAGTPNNLRATAYIESEVRKLGLVPAGDSGGYFQNLPLVRRTIDSTSTLTAGGATLRIFDDFVTQRVGAGEPRSIDGVTAVYGGPLDRTDSFPVAQAAGRLVVFGPPTSPQAPINGGAILARFRDAAGLAVTGLERIPPQFKGFLRQPSYGFAEAASGPATPVVLQLTTPAAARLLGTLLDSAAAGTVGPTIQARITTTTEPAPARNVVAILRGSDPDLRGEYVAIGAHNDHIGLTLPPVDHDSMRIFNQVVRPQGAEQFGKQATPAEQARVDSLLARWRAAHPGTQRADSIDNGADDDGSGTVSVLEIAQRLATDRVKPKRSIIFVWHTGEELGLFGSRWFTDHPTVPRDSIVAQLNIDMIGRGDSADETGLTKDGAPIHGNPNYLQLIGSRRLSTELGDLVERVNADDHHGLVFDYSLDANGHPQNIYCRSDHASYARYGIPVVFFTTGGHADYHQVTDEPEYIDYEHMARVANLIEDVAVHVADLDHRLVVDHPKPDPNGACQQ
ncbi:MAG TPA: M20/M25/M40 family metallo-hydrolase [Gemmatimonadales bacterium]|nr:M20/M25/M40 family metallo-hydrolase [Gemmatimonadales bacterium]